MTSKSLFQSLFSLPVTPRAALWLSGDTKPHTDLSSHEFFAVLRAESFSVVKSAVSNTSSIPSYSAYAPSNVGYSQKASSVATSSSTYYEDEYCEIDDNTSETSSKPYYDPVRDV